MDNLFLALALLSILGLFISLIKPSWLKLKSRKQSLVIFGAGIILFPIFFGMTSDSKHDEPVTQPTVTEKGSTVPATPAKPLSLEEQITNAVNTTLGPTNNTKKPTVVKVDVDTYNAVELKDYGYKSDEDVKGIVITINSSENLTANLQKGTMDDEATKIFQATFPLSSQIGDIIIWSQIPTKDQYGNTKDDTAIVFGMGRPLFGKINWTSLNHRDLPTLLKSENKLDDRNAYNELIKF